MKKYNRFIFVSIMLYLILASSTLIILLHIKDKDNHAYYVESNRIIHQITDIKQIDNFDLAEYEYIQKLEFLSITETNQTMMNDFYMESNDNYAQILPYYQNQQLQGYIKLTYILPQININNIIIILEISLFLLEIFIIIILMILKKKIILPFQRLTELPLELSQGHFHGEIKEEKSRYFGRYIWGMNQLRDELESSQKRQLELLKEKKKMLLSLSHDMKTPLNLIKLYSKALYQDVYQDEESKKDAIKQIEIKTEEIEKYIDEIIHSSREDILDLQVNNSEFYLAELINRVRIVYQEKCSLRHIDLQILPFENKIIQGDLERSQEVLENILENALKYGDGRKIEISFDEEDYCQLIKIFNTGECVSDTEINHVFESFYRGANSQGKNGNGLGLYICYELMSKMGGTIFVNKCQDGMIFTVVFR